MGTLYAVANQKGGVGKTATAVNLAACFGEAGMRTLLVDLDPQCNATVALGIAKDRTPGVYEALAGSAPAELGIVKTEVSNLDLLPASPGLAGANIELPREDGYEEIFKRVLGPLRDRYDFVFIDCPPSLGPLTVGALAVVDQLVVPVQAEYFALEGLAGLLETVELIKRSLNPELKVSGLLITMFDSRTRLSQDVEGELRTHFPDLTFKTTIPRNVRIGEAPSYGKPVIHHDPHCAGSDAYFELTKEVIARG